MERGRGMKQQPNNYMLMVVEYKLSKGGDPDFSGIKGAVISVDENMRADRAGDFFRLREEAIMKGDDDKIKEIESDFFKRVWNGDAKDG